MWLAFSVFDEFPFSLLKMIDSQCIQSPYEIADAFFSTNRCCLDPNFGDKLRGLYGGPADMSYCPVLRETLQMWALCCRSTR
jgi:hypothetical protein